MHEDLNELIRSYFDFEHEDQPEFLSGYKTALNSMWNYAKLHNLTDALRDHIEKVLKSDRDAATEIGFYFLPGKHEVEDILKLALERMPSSMS